MGQGYSLSTQSAGSAGIDVPELADLAYEKALGDARFMKTIRARQTYGLVVAKVVVKPHTPTKFLPYIKEIMRERAVLASIPNTLGYHRAFETSTNGYLVRQYTYSSVYDRMSTRPFLEDIEKRWLAFQLLSAVRDCHANNIYHGDIKTENALVTSWNWLLLADFSSSFKPHFLPEDDPADFSFFFDISGRRTCYIAPERFVSSGEPTQGRNGITWATDIFSVGCVLAELFLETPIFNLEQMLKYRKQQYDPAATHLHRIEDADLRDMIAHMIQLEPESRYSADEYLNFWRQKTFPEYFSSFLHEYMQLMIDNPSASAQNRTSKANTGESDERIERVYNDYDKIAYFLGFNENTDEQETSSHPNDQTFPLHIALPRKRRVVTRKTKPAAEQGSFLFLNIVTSSLRSTARADARVRACELLLAFSEHLSDDAKLDRVLPFVVALLDDKSDLVKVAALKTMTQLLALVSIITPVNAYLFPEYIMPRLLDLIHPRKSSKPSHVVLIAYGQCLAPLAETAGRFLDSVQAFKADGSLFGAGTNAEERVVVQAYKDVYDVARSDLVRFFEAEAIMLLTDSNMEVRKAFLSSVASLCVFFGTAKASDVILSHLNTYLNDRDWKLKHAFFETIVSVAVYVGGNNLEEFILPLMIQALTDPEEFVVQSVLSSLSTMAELGLFQRSKVWELTDLVARFTMHPNVWIREASARFVSAATKYVSPAECECMIRPLVQPYLRIPITSYDEAEILDCLKPPLSRNIYDMMLTWAAKVEKGLFWRPVQSGLSSKNSDDRMPFISSRDLSSHAINRISKNEEDQQWLTRIHNAGLEPKDDFKLVALREYIWLKAKRGAYEDSNGESSRFDRMISLGDAKIPLTNVIFDPEQHRIDIEALNAPQENGEDRNAQTIADALLDASTTIGQGDHRNLAAVKAMSGESTPRMSPKPTSPPQNIPRRTGIAAHELPKLETLSSRPSSLASSPRGGEAISNRPPTLIRQRSNAMELLQGRNHQPGKASAETGTSAESAQGRIDVANASRTTGEPPLAAMQKDIKRDPSKVRFNSAHNYQGSDPTVLRLLDVLYLENYPVDEAEFGPGVVPAENRQSDQKVDQAKSSRWYPDGTLIAMLGEHTAGITRVVPSPDHAFFITGSHDGTVRIWDTSRLERNLAHRSRYSHKHESAAKITALCFIRNTHTFISCAADGSVNVVKIDCTETPQAATKYGKPRVLRQWTVPGAADGAYAMWIEHVKAETQSILFLATNKSVIHAIDLRTMAILYSLENPVHHGVPTCFCIDPDRHWLLVTTTNGVFDMWDLRFRLRVKCWAFHGSAPIHRVALHPVRGKGNTHKKHVIVAGGTGAADVTVWNLEKQNCVEVYRTAAASAYHAERAGAEKGYTPYSPWFPDSETRTNALTRLTQPPRSTEAEQPDSVQALFAGARTHHTTNRGRAEPRHAFLLTASELNKLRFWDLDHLERSRIVSGLYANEEQARMEMTREEMGTRGDVVVWKEMRDDAGANADGTAADDGPRRASRGRDGRANVGHRRSDGPATPTTDSARAPGSAPRSTVVSLQQQQLLRSHLDCITDMCVLTRPFNTIVSVDRSGMIYVFS